MTSISGICITNRLHPHLEEAIMSAIDLVTEIIIVDTGISKEDKKKIESFSKKIKFHTHVKPFTFAEQIREEAKKQAKNDWILYFDHDEIFPEKLKDYILKNIDSYDYFAIPRKNIIFDKWISHSRWWPDYQLRLVKKQSVRWDSNIYIHVQPELKGRGMEIEATENLAIIHYNYLSIEEYIQKSVYYAKAEAHDLITGKKSLTLHDTIGKSISEFVSRFFKYEGYKDGAHGLVLAVLQMFYYFLVFFFYWESKKYFSLRTDNLVYESNYLFTQGTKEISHWIVRKKLVSPSKTLKIKIISKLNSFFN